jgi:hypothetical protein
MGGTPVEFRCPVRHVFRLIYSFKASRIPTRALTLS